MNWKKFLYAGIGCTCGISMLNAQEVGVGTTSPSARLSVDIPASYVSSIFQASKGGQPLVTITNTGKVGVGTTNPAGMIHVFVEGFPQSYNFTYNLLGASITVSDTASSDTSVTLEVSRSIAASTPSSTAQYYGILSGITTDASSTSNYTAWITSIHANAVHQGTGTVGTLFGIASLAAAYGNGNIERAYAAKFTVAPYLGTITSAYGMRIEWPSFTLGVATRTVGVMIDNVGSTTGSAKVNLWTGATTTTIPAGEFNIYASGGRKSYFADTVGFGTTTPSSRVHIEGSLAKKIHVTNVNYTVTDDHTIVLTGSNLTLTIGSASGLNGREYRIVSQGNSNTLNVNYIDFNGASTNALPSNGAIVIQSDGINWYRVQ